MKKIGHHLHARALSLVSMREVEADIPVNPHEAQALGEEEGFGFPSLATDDSGSMLARNVGADIAMRTQQVERNLLSFYHCLSGVLHDTPESGNMKLVWF